MKFIINIVNNTWVKTQLPGFNVPAAASTHFFMNITVSCGVDAQHLFDVVPKCEIVPQCADTQM